MMRCCSNCGWLEVNPSGDVFCGYSDERTWKDEICQAWKDKDEPKTNADRIRAMTDEELAELLTAVAKHSANKLCESLKTVDIDLSNCNFHILYEAHLDWLKEEASDEEIS